MDDGAFALRGYVNGLHFPGRFHGMEMGEGFASVSQDARSGGG